MPQVKSRKKGSGRLKKEQDDLGYSEMITPEKRAYHNKARDKAEQRTTASTKKSNEPTQETPTQETSTLDSPPSLRGRPPLGVEPMTPRTLQKRSTHSRSSSRKHVRISKMRSDISKERRWKDKQPGASNADDAEDSDANDNVSEHGDVSDDSELGQPLPDVEHEETVASEPASDLSASRATIFRRKARLIGRLPSNMIQHLDLFMATLYKLNRRDILPPFGYEYSSSLSKYQRLYRAKSIADDVFGSCTDAVKDEVMKYWLDIIMSHDVLERMLHTLDFVVPNHLLPKTVRVTQVAKELKGSFLSRDRTSQEQRVLGKIISNLYYNNSCHFFSSHVIKVALHRQLS